MGTLKRRLVRRWRNLAQPPATDQRREADVARDRGEFAEAAGWYRAHLALHPRDWSIWVQLGHALKESGDRAGALTAYQRAERLRPNDADLLLHLGHLHQIIGSRDTGQRYLRRSAARGGMLAREELIALGVPAAGKRTQGVHDWIVLRLLAARSRGVRIVGTGGMRLTFSGWLIGDQDPWVEMRPLSDWPSTLAELVVSVLPAARDGALSCKLYIDYGQGYSEERAIPFSETSNSSLLLVAYPALVRRIRWDPDSRPSSFRIVKVALLPITTVAEVEEVASRGAHGDQEKRSIVAAATEILNRRNATPASVVLGQKQLPPQSDPGTCYSLWRALYSDPTIDDVRYMDDRSSRFVMKPTFSVVCPIYNPPIPLLKQCLSSLLEQNYPPVEICLADDRSTDPDVVTFLREMEALHPSIKVAYRPFNGHISAASNSALALATGDYIVLVDQDDEIPQHALWTVAHYINENPTATVLFSDEDKIEIDGLRHSPYFKGAFDKMLMFGHNMVSHLGVYRRDLVVDIGGFREGIEGSQDYDLFLRCYAASRECDIVHIPHVLYHWRIVPGSTAAAPDQKSYAIKAARLAINDYMARTQPSMMSIDGFAPGVSDIASSVFHDQSVSVVILTRDKVELLESCVSSILSRRPRRTEIIIVDNGSIESETADYFYRIGDDPRIRVVSIPTEFNFSALNNAGVDVANGELICFLNNDTEVIAAEWIDRARFLLADRDIGVVGARLLYPDGKVQHFGLGLGMADHRVAMALNSGLESWDSGYFGKARLIQQFGAVTAACMFVRKADFVALGGFDPALRVAYNDVDLCLRFRKAGYAVVCDPRILLTHKESATRGQDADQAKRERLNQEARVMRERWSTELDSDPWLSPNHDLDRPDYALAYPPRVQAPWKHSSSSQETPVD